MFGVFCICSINVSPFQPAADLCQYNRAQVLYHALFNHLYTSEPQLIEVMLWLSMALTAFVCTMHRPTSHNTLCMY